MYLIAAIPVAVAVLACIALYRHSHRRPSGILADMIERDEEFVFDDRVHQNWQYGGYVPARKPGQDNVEYRSLLVELIGLHVSFGCNGCRQCNGCREVLGWPQR